MELSFQQTYKFALNSSSSKSQYLFPKAKRFPQPNKKQQKLKFYTLPSTISYQKEKAPSFPKLIKKMQFPHEKSKKIVPSPSTYSIKSDIERSISEKRGILIPQERLRPQHSTQTPGPTDYNPKKQPYLTSRYSIGNSKKKFEFPLELQKGKESPGPAYLVNVDKLEKVVSKYVHTKCLKVYSEPSLKNVFSKSILNPEARLLLQSRKTKPLTQRETSSFQREQKKKPVIPNFSNLFQNSKHHSSVLVFKNQPSVLGKFDKAERKTIFQTKTSTPGPEYNWFSEFSRLEKKAYHQRVQAQNKKQKNERK